MEQVEPSYTAGDSEKWCNHFQKLLNGSYMCQRNTHLTFDPAIPLLSIYPTDSKHESAKECTRMFVAALFIIINNWKSTKSTSTVEWINKLYIRIMEYNITVRSMQKLIVK